MVVHTKMRWRNLLPPWRAQRTPCHCIVTYHRVLPDQTPGYLLEALSGEVVTQAVFTQQLTWLKRHYRVVSLDELLDQRENLDALPMTAITFDDGMADNLSQGLPVLKTLELNRPGFVGGSNT